MLFADRIRQLRGEEQSLQRQLAVARDIDTPLFSKIERGECRVKRKQVIAIAKILKYDETELLSLWLADRATAVVEDKQKLADKALDIAKRIINE